MSKAVAYKLDASERDDVRMVKFGWTWVITMPAGLAKAVVQANGPTTVLNVKCGSKRIESVKVLPDLYRSKGTGEVWTQGTADDGSLRVAVVTAPKPKADDQAAKPATPAAAPATSAADPLQAAAEVLGITVEELRARLAAPGPTHDPAAKPAPPLGSGPAKRAAKAAATQATQATAAKPAANASIADILGD